MTAFDAAWLDEHPDWDVYAYPIDTILLQALFAATGRRDLETRVIAHRWMPEALLFAVDRTTVTDEAFRERVAEGLQRDLDGWLRNQEIAHRSALEQSVINATARHRPRLGDITGL